MASLVGGIVNDAQNLIKQQFTLLKSEVQEEIRQARAAATLMAAGCGVAALGGLLLALVLVHLLEAQTDIPLWGCYAIVGGVITLIGVVLLVAGRKEASNVELTPPPQTTEAAKENLAWLKDQTVPNKA
jgi:hypothetical protein